MAMKLGKLAILAAGLYAANKFLRKKPTPTPVGPNKPVVDYSPIPDSMATPPIVSPVYVAPVSPAPNVSQANQYVAPAAGQVGPQFTLPGYGVSGYKRRK